MTRVGRLILFAAFLAAVALASSAIAASLVHRYDFNTTNDTVGTANGTLVGMPALPAAHWLPMAVMVQ